MKRTLLILTSFVIICVLTGCRHTGNTVYAYFADIDETGWDPFDEIVFMPYPMDSVVSPGEVFDLAVCVRYRADSPIESIPLTIGFQSDTDNEAVYDTVAIPLPTNQGLTHRPSFYETCDTIRRMRIDHGFMVTVASLLRKEDAKGIVNIGMTLSRCPGQMTDNMKQ